MTTHTVSTQAAPPPRAVSGYLRAFRRYHAKQGALDAKLAALEPLRAKVATLKDHVTIRASRLTGGQRAAVVRLLLAEGLDGGPGL